MLSPMITRQNKYNIIGLMSGTSLDGLDIAHCVFEWTEGKWHYDITHAETIPYTPEWKSRLAAAEDDTALGFVQTDIEYGHLLGHLAKDFIHKHRLKPDLIASHGHTVFHQPKKRITSQIGRAPAIAAETGIPVASDFRALDVALGGQGAPLVPVGDRLLFGDYHYCLNLGGFANISFDQDENRLAFDICPANIVLNKLAEKAGKFFDQEGKMAREGKILPFILEPLNALPYYHQPAPKSLGKEWVQRHIWPLLNDSGQELRDLLSTYTEHIAIQVSRIISDNPENTMLTTGGGAFNDYLIERIRKHTKTEVILPDPDTINFKEALVFAFLGVLRLRNETNCLKSVTGASRNSTGGTIS